MTSEALALFTMPKPTDTTEPPATGTAHVRPKRRTRARLSKVANARDTVRGFGKDMDVIGLTYGQFSLLDLIGAALEYTGPADLCIGTWAVGYHDMDATHALWQSGHIKSLRLVIDSGQKRGSAGLEAVVERFGPECVRMTRTHAKFVTLVNDEWNVVITSSMNLNRNIRCEQFEMTDDADRADLFRQFVDEVFDELPAGVTDDRSLPVLRGMADVRPDHAIECGAPIKVGPQP